MNRNLNAWNPAETVTAENALACLEGVLSEEGSTESAVRTLVNGDEIFPALIAAAEAAERTINFETYIYWSGEISHRFAEVLSARARAGVEVNVIVDWYGCAKMDQSIIESMRSAGVRANVYNRPRWWCFWEGNHRTHRKIMVVDGRVGFTGGVGIADCWSGDANDETEWRDDHFRMEGPAVRGLQRVFEENWRVVGGEGLEGDGHFPELGAAGAVAVQVYSSSPGRGVSEAYEANRLALRSAKKNLRLNPSYFVPDPEMEAELIRAVQRGVRVEVIVPGRHIDETAVRLASRARWDRLLEGGVEIFEFKPTMIHRKAVIVDDFWLMTGSANFDNRSFRINDEVNVNVIDHDVVAKSIRLFEADKQRCERITLEGWLARPWTEKIADYFANLFRAQL
ncbi:MAG: phosphatidylserine/phosphatidylglycerophosphate/cardiolipin synthase family protein [Chthoniobacterales bacterium]